MKQIINTTLIFVSLISFQLRADSFPTTPDPKVTSGDFCSPDDPDFVGYRYKEKVPFCLRNVTYETKTDIYREYNVPERCRAEYTVDHFIPLAIGGSNSKANLWPEHKHVKATRQNLEVEIYNQLRRGEISQEQATHIIVQAKMNPPPAEPSNCR